MMAVDAVFAIVMLPSLSVSSLTETKHHDAYDAQGCQLSSFDDIRCRSAITRAVDTAFAIVILPLDPCCH